ncbi:MAG: trypsin-like peptidase domain-containing protein [bacterium]|nr:trypsin-like peptidase domain-containing protein [bacterium]
MPDTPMTPAPKPQPRYTQSALTLAVILSLILGTIGGALGGAFASGNFDSWFNRTFNKTSVASSSSGSSTTLKVEEESATIDVVEKVQKSVVSIIITKDLSKIYNQSGAGLSPFDLFFGNGQQPSEGTKELGGGSGFILSADGYIMTNKHVVDDAQADYTVLTNDAKSYSAKVIATDPVNDLAVLKIDAKDLPAIEFGNSEDLQIGQTVIAIGNALGEYRNTVTKGVVSGLARRITAGDGQSSETLENAIQTDAAINPGNSGGPLLNLAGQVIGVNVAVSQQGQLIGFAIPANQANTVFESVKKTGRIVRPYLGVRYIPITKALKDQNKLSVDYGVLIQRGTTKDELAIIPGGPADKAGLQENDIILEINGVKLDTEHSLAGEIQKRAPGDTITLKVLSKGQEKTVTATLEEYKQ